MRTKQTLITVFFFLIFSSYPLLAAAHQSPNVVRDFTQALFWRKNEQLAKTYLDPSVKIPEIRENTPIRGVAGLPSPKKDVRVVVARFREKVDALDGQEVERIAFIWEITVHNNKITDIRVVYDGANPLMNEVNAVKEYEAKYPKYHNKILVPSRFPFEITHVQAYTDQEQLMLRYRNVKLHGLLQISIVPKIRDLEHFKGKYDKFVTLKDGTKALYQPKFPPAYQLIFQKGGLEYKVGIGKDLKSQKVMSDELILIAESMLGI